MLAGRAAAWGQGDGSTVRAYARILVYAEAPKAVSRTGDNEAGGDDSRRFQRTQLILVKSRLVLQAALKDEKVSKYRMVQEQADPISWLEQELTVRFVQDSDVLEIACLRGATQSRSQAWSTRSRRYMSEVVNVDVKRQTERHAKLKKIKDMYSEILKERRNRFRHYSREIDFGKEPFPTLYQNLMAQNIQLDMERAEAETLLARRKKAAGAETDQVRKEIAQLDDRIAVLTARKKVLDDGLEQVKPRTADRRRSSIRPEGPRRRDCPVG